MPSENKPKRPERPQRLRPGSAPGLAGGWLWACRTGYENDLAEEIQTADAKVKAAPYDAGLVVSSNRPTRGGTPVELAFARQGFPVAAVATGDTQDEVAQAIVQVIRPLLGGSIPFAIQVFTADSEAGSRLAPYASFVEEAVLSLLLRDETWRERCVHVQATRSGRDRFCQVCLLDRKSAAVGVLPVGKAVSLAVGGQKRISILADSPSRSAAKLREAFAWLGQAPEPGDNCVDLGAAPGGWLSVVLERRARVLAVDPARLSPTLLKRRGLFHAQQSAFQFTPDEAVDWLLCDMAWRPLEVAALLAKWGRRRWARFLIANIKLPMRRKVDMIRRVREILETGGWKDIRVRHLYHDRDEVTLAAWHLT